MKLTVKLILILNRKNSLQIKGIPKSWYNKYSSIKLSNAIIDFMAKLLFYSFIDI